MVETYGGHSSYKDDGIECLVISSMDVLQSNEPLARKSRVGTPEGMNILVHTMKPTFPAVEEQRN